MSKNKTQTISVSTLVKSYYEYKISCYLKTYPRKCRLKSQNACNHSVQNTIYKTAHLKVFYRLLDVSTVAFCVDLSLF